MFKSACLLIILGSISPVYIYSQSVTGALGESFSYRVVADLLSDPWAIKYGPDNHLWVTEAKSYRVSRIDPATGAKNVLLDLNGAKNFGREQSPQGGLMGLALHPQFLNGSPFVYLAYVYQFSGCLSNDGGCFFKTKIERYQYDAVAHLLINPVTLVDTIPGSNDHNGGRLLVSNVLGKNYLFYSVGDMGAGQFNNGGRKNNAQDTKVYEGKILRLNLDPDGDDGPNKWIPNNNPYNSKKAIIQSAVWSIGHRNPQGLADGFFAGGTRLFSVEHGPFSDDEVNVIIRRHNYGHPFVVGINDGNYDGLSAAATANTNLPGKWQTSVPYITSERANAAAIGTAYENPIKTFYPSSNGFLDSILTAVKKGNYENGFPNASAGSWQSEAVSSIACYASNAIPGWKNSLLITTLKGGKLIRLQLDNDGKVSSDTINYFKGANRYRDVTISPDGTKIYLAVDSSLITSGPSATNPQVITNRGSILEFTYHGNVTRFNNTFATVNTSMNKTFTISPNPAKDWIILNSTANAVDVHNYKINDLGGRIVSAGKVYGNGARINIRNLAPGLYILHLVYGHKKITRIYKFLKE